MLAFGHTAIGSAIGIVVYQQFGGSNTLQGLALVAGSGIISHYIADAIPHGHFIKSTEYKKKAHLAIIFDLFLSVMIFLGLIFFLDGFSLKLVYMIFGIAGAQLPDVLDGLIYIDKVPNNGVIKIENSIHQAMHWHGQREKALPLGIRDVWQLSVVLGAMIFIS